MPVIEIGGVISRITLFAKFLESTVAAEVTNICFGLFGSTGRLIATELLPFHLVITGFLGVFVLVLETVTADGELTSFHAAIVVFFVAIITFFVISRADPAVFPGWLLMTIAALRGMFFIPIILLVFPRYLYFSAVTSEVIFIDKTVIVVIDVIFAGENTLTVFTTRALLAVFLCREITDLSSIRFSIAAQVRDGGWSFKRRTFATTRLSGAGISRFYDTD